MDYEKRTDDFGLSGLSPDAITNLTDTQKINVKIIQNITSLNTAINDLQHDVRLHDKLLVTGNGEPSYGERLRSIEDYIRGLKYWSRFIGGAIVIQTVAFFIATIVALVRFLPILEKLANQP